MAAATAATAELLDGTRARSYAKSVCRNIRVLHNFQPPTTPEEIQAASLQYVRKVSGLRAPGKADVEAFDQAIAEITEATARLLAALPPRGEQRTRDGERAKARLKWTARATRIAKTAGEA